MPMAMKSATFDSSDEEVGDGHQQAHTHTHTLSPKHQQILLNAFKGAFELAHVICQRGVLSSQDSERMCAKDSISYLRGLRPNIKSPIKFNRRTCRESNSRAPAISSWTGQASQYSRMLCFHMCVCTCSFVQVGHPIQYGILMYVFDLFTLEPSAGVQGFAGKKHQRVARKCPFVKWC